MPSSTDCASIAVPPLESNATVYFFVAGSVGSVGSVISGEGVGSVGFGGVVPVLLS